MKITYKTQGTCSSHIEVEVEDDVIQQVSFGADAMETYKVSADW